jgi:hypothetical protein
MAKKRFWMGMVMGALVFLFFGGCYTPPKANPLTSQTLVIVQRYPAMKASNAKLPMEIYIDDHFSQFTVADNQSVSIPVNDGVHHIYVKVRKFKSETLNFTAEEHTVSFLASIESSGALFWKKVRVSLSRTTVTNVSDTMTNEE